MTKAITKTYASQIRFWNKDWEQLSYNEVATYLAFIRVPFLNDSNRSAVKAAYLTDSHVYRLKPSSKMSYTPTPRELGFRMAIMLMLCLFVSTIFAQIKVTKDSHGNFVAATTTTTGKTKTPDKVVAKYTDAKGTHDVYMSINGKYYILVTSKSGNEYRKYLKVS